MRKLLFQSLFRRPFTEPAPSPDDAALAELATAVGRAARRRLGRSLSIREVDAGSCNGCELEIHALNNAYYDVERFGLRFVASPRHADVLMVTGPVTKNMREALERTYHATPDPKWVVAIGDCARDGGCFAGSYAVVGGVSEVIPVDLHIPGCPPTPTAMLKGAACAARTGGRRQPLRREDSSRCCAVCSTRPLQRRARKTALVAGPAFVFGFATCSRSRTPRPPVVLGTPGLISSIPAFSSAETSFISESTLPRITPSLASMRWMVGTERSARSAVCR